MKNSQAVVDAYLEPPDIHDIREVRMPGLILPLIAGIVLLVLHGFNVYLLLYVHQSLWRFMEFHILFTALTALVAWAHFKLGKDGRYMAMLTLACIPTGPFAAGGTIVGILLYLLFRLGSIHFSDWFQTMFPYTPPILPEAIHEDIITGRDESSRLYSVVPFMDVLTVGSEAQKSQALAKMTLQFHPSFAPAFRKALHDRSNMIRVQAATAIAKIENQFLERLMDITRVHQEWPDDEDVLLALAEHYDNYAFTGILDPEREYNNRQKALEHYLEYLKYCEDNIDVRSRVGRLLVRKKRPEEAAVWLRECIELEYYDDALLLWYYESLYQAGKFAELREQIVEHPLGEETLENLSEPLREALALWGQTVPERQAS